MVHAFTKKITRIIGLFLLAFALGLLIPVSVMAERETLPCAEAHLQIEHTQNILRPLQRQQQQLQKNVRTTYQQLFVCKAETPLSMTQQQHCSQLQEEGPKLFQAMVEAITLSHQTSHQLAKQTRQAQLACPTITEETSLKIASLEHS